MKKTSIVFLIHTLALILHEGKTVLNTFICIFKVKFCIQFRFNENLNLSCRFILTKAYYHENNIRFSNQIKLLFLNFNEIVSTKTILYFQQKIIKLQKKKLKPGMGKTMLMLSLNLKFETWNSKLIVKKQHFRILNEVTHLLEINIPVYQINKFLTSTIFTYMKVRIVFPNCRLCFYCTLMEVQSL